MIVINSHIHALIRYSNRSLYKRNCFGLRRIWVFDECFVGICDVRWIHFCRYLIFVQCNDVICTRRTCHFSFAAICFTFIQKKRQTKRRMLLKRSQTFVKRDALHIKKVFCRFLITEKNEIDIEIKWIKWFFF